MGNDVVDRRAGDAAGKSGNDRFVRRVLIAEEYRAFAESRDPERDLWILWAAKETAYKAISKLWPEISAAPRQYRTVFENGVGGNDRTGVVQTPKQPVYIRVMIRKEYIHCIGQTRPHPISEDMRWGLEIVEADGKPDRKGHPELASQAVRQAAADRLSACLGMRAADIAIRRHPGSRGLGPPVVYIRDEKSGIDLSLSHHGRFAAYLFYAPQV